MSETTITTAVDEYGNRIEPIPAYEVPDLLQPAYGGWRGSLLDDDGQVSAVMLLGIAPFRHLLTAACLYGRHDLMPGEELVLHISNVRTELARFVRFLDARDDEAPWHWRLASSDESDTVTITVADITCGGPDTSWDNLVDIAGAAAALASVPRRGVTVRTLVDHTLRRHYPGEWCRRCRQPVPCTPVRQAAARIGLDIDPDHYGPEQPCTCHQPRCNWHSPADWGCMTRGCDCRWYPEAGGADIPPRLAGQRS